VRVISGRIDVRWVAIFLVLTAPGLGASQCPSGSDDCQYCEGDVYSKSCGKSCDLSTTCHAHGRCIGSTGNCKCFAGWKGEFCNIGTSGCPDGYTEADCQPCEADVYTGECKTSCDMMTSCSGNGRCAGLTGECKCFGGWSGNTCLDRTKIVAVTPSTSPASGGSMVTVEIDYFEYTTNVKVEFDVSLILPGDISVWTVSNKYKFFVQFTLPATPSAYTKSSYRPSRALFPVSGLCVA